MSMQSSHNRQHVVRDVSIVHFWKLKNGPFVKYRHGDKFEKRASVVAFVVVVAL